MCVPQSTQGIVRVIDQIAAARRPETANIQMELMRQMSRHIMSWFTRGNGHLEL
jgi:hypothetical protein